MRRYYDNRPTAEQMLHLRRIVEVINKYKRPHEKKKRLAALVAAGYIPESRRLYPERGHKGVGSYCYMPKFRCFRVQVACSHIDSRKPCSPYALCIEL